MPYKGHMPTCPYKLIECKAPYKKIDNFSTQAERLVFSNTFVSSLSTSTGILLIYNNRKGSHLR